MLIFIGCTSIKSVERYNKKNEKSQPSSDIRFTSEGDTTNISEEEVSEEIDPSDFPDDASSYDLAEVLKKIKNKDESSSVELSQTDAFLMEIIKYYKTPYKFGGNSMNGIDCSGFTQAIFKNVLDINLKRSAREQFQQGEVIEDRSQLQFGDLVFFNTRRRVRPGHVGIYLWDNLFVHANTKNGVTVNSLDEDYYSKRYMGARRIFSEYSE